jgi:YtcA family
MPYEGKMYFVPLLASFSPSQNIVGSYFPSWMLCAFIGIALTAIFYYLFVKIGIHAYIPAKMPVYLGLAISITFFFWLFWFGN